MKTFVVFVACLAAVSASNLDDGISVGDAQINDGDENEARIISGISAEPGQFPWQAGIFFTKNNQNNFCGGALIHREWVLTAAHCVADANNFKVILGATKAYDAENGKIQLKVIEAWYHPDFNYPSSLNNDVAVLRLERAVTNTSRIQPIRLARKNNYLQPNTNVWVSGWGKTSDQPGQIVNQLNYVQLLTISNTQCKTYFNSNLIQNSVVCCQGSGTRSTCSGDSGGPLIKSIGPNTYEHVGIVSFVSTDGCAKEHPTGYTRTADVIDFINLNTGLNFP